MKKLLLILLSLTAISAHSATYKGQNEMDQALVGNENVEVTEIVAGEKYNLKMNYAGQLQVDTTCEKDRVSNGSIVFSCMIYEEENHKVDLVFWKQMGIQDMITIDLNTGMGLRVNLERID
ncbi:hypothetical protein ABMA79_11765 [Halobacteriovorax sp. HFRX-2_2]|uniref:hypothetical protein n=1 Tax=unclassified Halobacteriovorax TaxID=2639665 RepID=UPI003722A32A